MTNTQMLEAKIAESGLKKVYIAKKLGISQNTFAKKLANKVDFKAGEISILVALLGVSDREVVQIFLS